MIGLNLGTRGVSLVEIAKQVWRLDEISQGPKRDFRLPSGPWLAAVSAVVLASVVAVVLLTGLGGHHVVPPAKTLAPPSASVSSASATGLAGTWWGEYGGADNGRFTLRWRQSGSVLTGTITISNPPRTLAIHGILDGNAIHFGTVGSEAIAYTGTVSGDSMHGTYQVGSSGGSWSAAPSP